MKENATPSGLSQLDFRPQGSRGGNPGLEVGTASRFLIQALLKFVDINRETADE